MSEDTRQAVRFCIADIGITLRLDLPLEKLQWDNALLQFARECEDGPSIRCLHEGVPRMHVRQEDLVFDSQAGWSLYRVDGQHVFFLRDVVQGPDSPYVAAFFDQEFRTGEIHRLVRDSERSPLDGLLNHPLTHPLGQVLMICLLGQGRGLMVHACGIAHEGQGYLFCGQSTHGKTTMAHLWEGNATVLNDDRIILRRCNGRVWMYGTPWHGDRAFVSPRGVPLDKLFFLSKGPRNSAVSLVPADACAMALARSFPPIWDYRAMEFTLGFLSDLVSEIPCYNLAFVPDASIVEFVSCVQ